MDLFSKVGFLRNSAINSSKYSVCLQVTNYSALKHLCGRRTKNIWVSAALAVLKLKPNVKLNGSLFPRPCFLESVYVCHDAVSISIISMSSKILSFLRNFFLNYPSSLRFLPLCFFSSATHRILRQVHYQKVPFLKFNFFVSSADLEEALS